MKKPIKNPEASALNTFFEGSEGHHINKDEVIYILINIHRSVSHNLHTGKNMEIINQIALQSLVQDK